MVGTFAKQLVLVKQFGDRSSLDPSSEKIFVLLTIKIHNGSGSDCKNTHDTEETLRVEKTIIKIWFA